MTLPSGTCRSAASSATVGRRPSCPSRRPRALVTRVEQVTGVDREAHGATRVGHATGDGLADPPGGVGRELETLAPVELLHRVDQPQVALLDQIEQWQLRGLILLGDGDHQAQVGRDEGLGGLLAVVDPATQLPLAGRRDPRSPVQFTSGLPGDFDGLGQSGLGVLGEQGMLTDVVQIEADQVLVGLRSTLNRHWSSSLHETRRRKFAARTSPERARAQNRAVDRVTSAAARAARPPG